MKAEWLDRYNMLPPGTGVLCALSGGADSMYLLHQLISLREDRCLQVCAAHYNHGLRGAESERDAAFVAQQCGKLNVPLMTGRGDVSARARENRAGIEETARNLRYAFLNEAADALSCSRIATAHTLNDQAETVLMNLCRGSGTRGLAGIPPVRGRIIRPLLQTGRDEIIGWLRENGVPWVEDSSNDGSDYTRNRFRHDVMPLLLRENPSSLAAIGRAAELLREDDACLCRMAEAFLRDYWNGSELPAKKLLGLETAVAARVLRTVCGTGLSRERTQALLRFAEGTERGVLELPGQKVHRSHGMLRFEANLTERN